MWSVLSQCFTIDQSLWTMLSEVSLCGAASSLDFNFFFLIGWVSLCGQFYLCFTIDQKVHVDHAV